MKKARVIPAPRQDDVRVVVLGASLWPDRVTLYALVESDQKEITESSWEGDQADMFGLQDDLGTSYERGNSASASGHGEDDHVRQWMFSFSPGVPENASTLTVSHIVGSVVLDL